MAGGDLLRGVETTGYVAVEQSTAAMTGGEAIVAGLLGHGIDVVFGLPGAQIYGLFDAFHQAQPRLKTIGARHEQACAYMAFGYARSTGRAAVYAVAPGEGMLNSSAALATAYGCNAPVLLVTGQAPTAFLGKGRGQLHELPDQLATLRSLTKWAARIEYPTEAPWLVARAFQEMLSGRRGPVALEMPWDIFTTPAEVTGAGPLPLEPEPEPDAERVSDAARLLRESKAPMIMVGGGALDAGAEVLELAELVEAPVVSFRSGRGVVSDAHELGLTVASGYRLWPRTDLLIGIGTRLEVPNWRWPYQPAGLKIIRIDIDPAEMRRCNPDIGIVAGATAGVRALIKAASGLGVRRSGRRDAIRCAKAEAEREIREALPQMAYLDVIRQVLPAGGFFVDELSQAGFASWYGFPVYQPRTFISSGYSGTLGFGFQSALGVKIAHPDKPVISIAGDGGFLFGVQELATAVQHRIGVVCVVFNNNAFGNVLRDQQSMFGGRVLGAHLVNPDFLKLADAFGVRSGRARSPEELRPMLERAFADGGPWLIEIPVEPGSEASPWRFIHPKPHPGAPVDAKSKALASLDSH
jgi:acetolactate synthase I/II/III large subunit